ncbi:MAG TPA: hypothetical protein VFM40_05870 [Actinomycetota bacterium]|nr:hypothetical protein [Actinomycetota bacterium]
MVLLVAGWVALDIATWRRRHRLSPSRAVRLLTQIAALGAAGVVAWSVLGDHGAWWIGGACVLAAIQLIAAVRVS